jgi:hypothetical protein
MLNILRKYWKLTAGEAAIVGACLGTGFGLDWSTGAIVGIVPVGVIGAVTLAATLRPTTGSQPTRPSPRATLYYHRPDPYGPRECKWTITNPVEGFRIVGAKLRASKSTDIIEARPVERDGSVTAHFSIPNAVWAQSKGHVKGTVTLIDDLGISYGPYKADWIGLMEF